MRLLLLFLTVLPTLLSALSPINIVRSRRFINTSDFALQKLDGDTDMTKDHTTFKEFVPYYIDLFKKMFSPKTRENYQAHIEYVDVQMMFNECNARQYENFAMFNHWLQQFVANHEDPIIEIKSQRQTGEDMGEVMLNIDVQALWKYRVNFDMRVSFLNDQSLGWKVLFVDRSIGCHH
ncbi:hypothetical protein GCK72_008192 [Caenorhabditis remanei]|nr:hypothetical protein GCK72_008192 [Caenorhabditis remanei]KAF1759947.1 hypothetical protein GCK72_008192 [Caenorhabditis remanei]